MNRTYYSTPEAGPFMRFLWKAAGADRHLLQKSTYSDQVKYMCMGGIVLATGLMAGIAGGYAFYTIFEPKGNAIDTMKTVDNITNQNYQPTDIPTAAMSFIFGIVWGLIIFNLDRFIVSSSGKGDGTEAITWDELKSALPRLFMGMIIALTISKPIEIRMFKSEIDAELYKMQKIKQQEYDDETRREFAEKTAFFQQKKDSLSALLLAKRSETSNAASDWKKEMAGEGANGKYGEGPGARAKKAVYDQLQQELSALEVSVAKQAEELEHQIKPWADNRDKEFIENIKRSNALDGLLERIKLAHEIAGTWISLFITLLFMAIELTPIFFKLMLIQGPYDYMSDNVKELIKAEHGIEVRYDYYKDKKGLERNLVIFHQPSILMHEKAKWAEAQKELSESAILKWKAGQQEKMNEDLSAFIKED